MGIIEEIRREAPVTFERYMELCLYHEAYGYYARGVSIGRGGDYITSPSYSGLFGRALALQVLQIKSLLGAGDDFLVVEAGAGEGYLAYDILSFCKERGERVRYAIVEPFPSYRSRQEELLKEFWDRVEWVSSADELPTFKGVFLSNELFDSFPVHLVEMTEEGLKEVYVDLEDGRLCEVLGELSSYEILERVSDYAVFWPVGYRTEVCTSVEPFFKEVAKRLVSGAFLTVDYGYTRADYYHPGRTRGTLLCYYRQRCVENPYLRPGHQDITSHVDFTYLKELGLKYGLFPAGFVQQGTFLAAFAEELFGGAEDQRPESVQAFKFLVIPEGFGTSHWVLVQARDRIFAEVSLKGFRLANRRRLLT